MCLRGKTPPRLAHLAPASEVAGGHFRTEVGNITFFYILYPINIMAQKVIYYHVYIISKKVIYDSYHIIYP
jgi:hypothetical protein